MSSTRTPLVAGNWKMHKSVAEAESFIGALLPRIATFQGVDVAICPPFTALQAMVDSARGSGVAIYAQTMHEADSGAFTGEISPSMLVEVDVDGVLLGHSERRQLFGETDKALQAKVPAALAADLLPVLCVGETEEERERGDMDRKLRHQVTEGLEKVPADRLAEVVVAYEPIWAIGTGQVATTEQAQEAIAFVRALVATFDKAIAAAGADPLRRFGQARQRRRADRAARHRRIPRRRRLARGRVVRVARRDRRRSGLMATPVCLVVLDGWGLAPDGPGNAVSLADTPVFDDLWARYDHTTLTACGPAVGLPEGQMGNSEVGHLNLGAGTIVKQDLARIDEAVQDGSLERNETLQAALAGAERVHLIGLASDGGVHSSDRHLKALIEIAGRAGVPDLVIHAFTDGRDVLPTSGADFLREVQGWGGRIGSVIGRYYAMDRDSRAERTQKALDLLVHGRGEHHAESGEAAVRAAYERGETDEFVAPTTVGAEATIRDGDAVLAFNFRPDRMRQLSVALAGERDIRYTTLTEYDEGFPYPVVVRPARPEITIGSVVADAGLGQLHVAETEKYPHVTYFFNGGEEQAYPGELRRLVPSPRDVPTYDHKPEMSAREATDAFVENWASAKPGFAIINFANADMVGHTGVIPAAVKAIETVDACLRRVVEAVHARGGVCIVTADHGNADHMLEPDGSPNTAHSLNPVPLIVTRDGVRLDGPGILADVAPTALALMGIAQPPQMDGRSLLATA